MNIKVTFHSEISIYKSIETETGARFESVTIKQKSDEFLLSVFNIVEYYKKQGVIYNKIKKSDIPFGFTDRLGHSTTQITGIDEMEDYLQRFHEFTGKEFAYKTEYFNGRIRLQPIDATEEEKVNHYEAVRGMSLD